MHPLFVERAHAVVNDITGNEDEVWLFCIDHIDPAVQFLTAVVITDMKVAHHYNLHGASQWLLCGQLQRLHVFMTIVQIAI